MSQTPVLTLTHHAKRSQHVLSQDVGGEAVLLDLTSEQYYGLNAVGTRIWQLLESHSLLADVHRALCVEFNVDAATIERDILSLITDLRDAGLVTVE